MACSAVVAVCRVCHRIHCRSLRCACSCRRSGRQCAGAAGRSPRSRSATRCRRPANFFFASSTQAAKSASLTTRTVIGMKAWSLPHSSEHWPWNTPFAGRLEPGLVEAAGNGVDLDAERRHGEGMDHVGAGDQHVHDLVHRHDHFVVDGEQARLAGLEILVGDHQRVEFEIAVIRIVVAPVPLLAGRLHGQVGLRHVELEEQQPERRHRDRHQDDDRNDRPDHLEQRVVGGARRRRIGARIEAHHDDRAAGPARRA